MDTAVNVRAIEVLGTLRARLDLFRSNAQATIQASMRELQRAQEEMRAVYVQKQRLVEQCMQRYMEAQRALQACLASGSEEGPPDCSGLELELQVAGQALYVAQQELEEARNWVGKIAAAAQSFQSEARQYASLLEHDVPEANAFLDAAVVTLTAYTADQLISSTPLPTVSSPVATGIPASHAEAEAVRERNVEVESVVGSDGLPNGRTAPEGYGGNPERGG